ncbi:MAG: hypothetical protein WC220_15605, partial [Pedobacter sp.]
MKKSIRTKISIGLAFLFLIILVLSIFSGYYLNRLSNKTSAILKENFLSVVYAREMSENLTNINQEFLNSFLMNNKPDSVFIKNELILCSDILESAKNNITEEGEAVLLKDIEIEFTEFRDSVYKVSDSIKSVDNLHYLQKKYGSLYEKLGLLSQMNGKAIETKTDDAKAFSKKATTQMTILGTICFLIALSFTYSFGTYY